MIDDGLLQLAAAPRTADLAVKAYASRFVCRCQQKSRVLRTRHDGVIQSLLYHCCTRVQVDVERDTALAKLDKEQGSKPKDCGVERGKTVCSGSCAGQLFDALTPRKAPRVAA